MLTQLVNLLENWENGLSLSEISRLMNAQPTAVLSMVQLLVKKGKLLEIGPDNKCCTTCGIRSRSCDEVVDPQRSWHDPLNCAMLGS